MQMTNEELAAAHRLGETFLRFWHTIEQGSKLRDKPSAPAPAQISLSPKLLLTGDETCKALSISRKTLYRLTHPRGPIPSVKIGSGGFRYHVRDLETAIEQLKTR
jgi:excisionase family DNA binding protein